MPWLKLRLALALTGGSMAALPGCGSNQTEPTPVDTTPLANTASEDEAIERAPELPPLSPEQWCGSVDEVRTRFGDQGYGSECPPSMYEPGYTWQRDYTTEEQWTAAMGAGQCCYLRDQYISQPKRGRPLVVDGAARTADTAAAAGWAPGDRIAGSLADGLDRPTREMIAVRWARNGLVEHASVASFARATLELMALEAPPSLIAAVQRAAADEVRHAQMCFAIASCYAGGPVGPGPLAPAMPRSLDLVELAVATFEEACVPESIGALEAEHVARRARNPSVQRMLREIAEDEARHAELAWATVGWAIRRGGAPVIDAIRAAAAGVASPQEAPAAPIDRVLADHGLLTDSDAADLTRRAWREVIGPLVAEMA